MQDYSGNDYSTFDPIKYKSQVVAGINYIIQYDIGSGNTIQVKIF